MSQIDFLKIFLIPEIKCQKRCSFYFFGLFSKTALAIFLIFCMIVKDNGVSFELHIFSEKNILDYRDSGLWPFLQNSSKGLPNFFYMIIDDDRVHCLRSIAFVKKSIKGDPWLLLQNCSMALSNFLHGCRGQ